MWIERLPEIKTEPKWWRWKIDIKVSVPSLSSPNCPKGGSVIWPAAVCLYLCVWSDFRAQINEFYICTAGAEKDPLERFGSLKEEKRGLNFRLPLSYLGVPWSMALWPWSGAVVAAMRILDFDIVEFLLFFTGDTLLANWLPKSS